MEYVNVGKIYTTHGLNGEVKVKSNFNYKDKIYVNGFNFYIGKDKELYKLRNFRKQNEYDLLTFETLDKLYTENIAAKFKERASIIASNFMRNLRI